MSLVLDSFSRNIYVKFPYVFSLFYLFPDLWVLYIQVSSTIQAYSLLWLFASWNGLKPWLPRFPKICSMSLNFNQRPTLVLPVFVTWKKSEEDFCFYEKSHCLYQCRFFIREKWCKVNFQKMEDICVYFYFYTSFFPPHNIPFKV